MIRKFLVWLVVSSNNSEKYSLALKGALGVGVTAITILAGLAHVQVGDLTPVVDAVIALVQALFAVVSAVVFLYGTVRKVVRTLQGDHDGLNTLAANQ